MRWTLLFLVAVILIPLASASITISELPQTSYNYGESIGIRATINTDADLTGYLNIIANCGQTLNLDSIMLALKKGGSYQYQKEFLLTSDFTGACTLTAQTTKLDGIQIESANSGSFTVTSDLIGEFSINAQEFQLGETLSLSGSITSMNKKAINGIASIHLKKDGKTQLFQSVKVENGLFQLTKELSRVPAGDYSIDIKATDTYSNSKTFTNAVSFKLRGGLIFDSTLQEKYNPGDKISLTGRIRGDTQKDVKNIKVDFVLNDISQTQELSSSSQTFNFEYILPENVKSGEKKLILNAIDAAGNMGSKEFIITVSSIPTRLQGEVTSFNHIPEKPVEYDVKIIDQAEDEIEGNVRAELYDPRNSLISTKNVITNQKESFTLPQFATPDIWTIKFTAADLTQEVEFKVQEFTKLETSLQGEILSIKNIGNIEYNDKFHLIVDGADVYESISIDVNEIETIDLGRLLEAGKHNIIIPLTNSKYDNINIQERDAMQSVGDFFAGMGATTAAIFEGEPSSIAGLIIIALIVLIAIILIIKKVYHPKMKAREAEFKLGQKRKEELKRTNKSLDKKETLKYNQSDVDYLRKQAAKAYEEQRNKPAVMGKGEYVTVKKQNQEDGNIFDIFK